MVGLGKSALHFAALNLPRSNLNSASVTLLRALLAGGGELPDELGAFGFDYDLPELSAVPFYHGLQLIACPKTGTLVVRVHVFGVFRARFSLAQHYEGRKHLVRTYVEDPLGRSVTEMDEPCSHPLPWLMEFHSYFSPPAVVEYFDSHVALLARDGPSHEYFDRGRFEWVRDDDTNQRSASSTPARVTPRQR